MKNLLLVFLFLVPVLRAQTSGTPTSVTDAKEIRAGRVLAEKFVRSEGMKPTPQTTKIDEYLQSVGNRVAAHAQRKLPYHFRFDPSPKFKSAVGFPGGEIFVGSGILAYMDTEDQLAAVLGHEVEHIALNHCSERLAEAIVDQHLSIHTLNELKLGDFLKGYGHDNELAADREGAKLAMEAGYSANGAIRLLQTFVTLEEQMPSTPSEAKSGLQERIGQIQSLVASREPQPAEKPLALP